MSVVSPGIVVHAPHPNGGALCMGAPLDHGTLMISFAGVACEACWASPHAQKQIDAGGGGGLQVSLSDDERETHAERADHFPPNQLVYSLTAVEGIIADRRAIQ